MYKARGKYIPGRNSEKIIKIIATDYEKNIFINEASKLIKPDNKYEDFKTHMLSNWEKCEPYDEEEKKFFSKKTNINGKINVLRIYERYFLYFIEFFLASIMKSRKGFNKDDIVTWFY